MKNNLSNELSRVEVTEQLLNEIVQKIVSYFHPLKIVLFGSYAWGKPKRDSDVDLLVIMESNERPARRAVAVRDVCQPRFLSMDIMVRTPDEITERLEIGDFFFRNILKKGIVLYET